MTVTVTFTYDDKFEFEEEQSHAANMRKCYLALSDMHTWLRSQVKHGGWEGDIHNVYELVYDHLNTLLCEHEVHDI